MLNSRQAQVLRGCIAGLSVITGCYCVWHMGCQHATSYFYRVLLKLDPEVHRRVEELIFSSGK